ncbi:HAMP domain-containing histidine kinase [Phototrophicus methaneseepsis]|uniref:histidine kinase n=1 Tax=Phototrophicus methaneseepsis TaxID=2710758 RepID=A0A7S8E5L6_9CHLR|nr:HAMP domain-containing sensor histidine kinase [Phototrophicus methaneseepsis]QPC80796.1 HAMP domain-containing histidine kinase [Phototrophicus methaneseepsis]
MIQQDPEKDAGDAWDVMEILNIFAHDLKNPLGSVKSFVDLLSNTGDLDERQQHFVDRAMFNVMRMQQMIEELLDYARIDYTDDSGYEACDVQEIINYAVTLLQDVASRRRIEIDHQVETSTGPIWGQPRLLQHVMVNLVSNAVKYNRRGGTITIAARNEGPFVRIDVADTGIGIPPEKLQKVFDRFFRVKSESSQNAEGAGLGLAVVKAIVEKHNGRISVQSDMGLGSTFTVLLPREATLHANTGGDPRESLDAVDDNTQESADLSSGSPDEDADVIL